MQLIQLTISVTYNICLHVIQLFYVGLFTKVSITFNDNVTLSIHRKNLALNTPPLKGFFTATTVQAPTHLLS